MAYDPSGEAADTGGRELDPDATIVMRFRNHFRKVGESCFIVRRQRRGVAENGYAGIPRPRRGARA